LTQEDLATLWKLNRTTVVNIEMGRQRVSVRQLVVLAEHLGCATQELVPPLAEAKMLSDELRRKAPDERAFSFASEIAAANERRK
jgi:DNA-binding XRE family transcriptional regulator